MWVYLFMHQSIGPLPLEMPICSWKVILVFPKTVRCINVRESARPKNICLGFMLDVCYCMSCHAGNKVIPYFELHGNEFTQFDIWIGTLAKQFINNVQLVPLTGTPIIQCGCLIVINAWVFELKILIYLKKYIRQFCFQMNSLNYNKVL